MKNLSKVKWENLTSREKSQRKLSLEVLRLVRKGNSLGSALKEVGFNYSSIKLNLGKNIFKRKGRFQATKTDSIQRSMEFYDSRRGRIFIVVKNSKNSSKLGRYFSAVRSALEGDKSNLKKFKGKYFTDAYGKKYKFETKIEKIYDIEEGIEEPEFREIYEEVEA